MSDNETLETCLDKRNHQWKKRYKKKGKFYNVSEPITSYGLILFTIKEREPLFLLYQRRDNFEYMDFLRGVWASEGQLPALFSLMSIDERWRIRNYTFEELWDDLWVEHNCKIYKEGFPKAKKKYDMIRHRIQDLVNTTNSCIESPPWGFPKGKKNSYKETSIECALREFIEETKFPRDRIKIVDRSPLTENFKGSNGRAYATHYFIARINDFYQPIKYETPHCIRNETMSEEASNVSWFTVDKACSLLNLRRQSILRRVLEIIKAQEFNN